jgi:hypothetical protein
MTKFAPAAIRQDAPPTPKPIADLLALSAQLTSILARETAALRSGAKDAFKPTENDKARAMALYHRELNLLRKDPNWAKGLHPAIRAKLEKAGVDLHEALKAQSDLIARRRHVGEGIVQAIAKEVAAKRQGASPYAKPNGARPAAASAAVTAITLNSVV